MKINTFIAGMLAGIMIVALTFTLSAKSFGSLGMINYILINISGLLAIILNLMIDKEKKGDGR